MAKCPKCHFIFDFDETLVDTSDLRPYRNTTEGRRYVAEFPEKVSTCIVDPRLIRLTNRLAELAKISIATNSAGDYTKALLRKHGFSTNIKVYDDLGKPDHEKLQRVVKRHRQRGENVLSIGDSASDVLAGHGCSTPTVAVAWGKTSSVQQLKQAEPVCIVRNFDELKGAMEAFAAGKISYTPRSGQDNFFFIDPAQYNYLDETEIEIYDLGPYYPTRHELFKRSQSYKILRLKDAKNFTIEEIRAGALDHFFYDSEIRSGGAYLEIISDFFEKIQEKLSLINLSGNSFAIASPNSSPEFCYKMDINQVICWHSSVRLRIEQFQLVVDSSNLIFVIVLRERLIQGHFLIKSQTRNL